MTKEISEDTKITIKNAVVVILAVLAISAQIQSLRYDMADLKRTAWTQDDQTTFAVALQERNPSIKVPIIIAKEKHP